MDIGNIIDPGFLSIWILVFVFAIYNPIVIFIKVSLLSGADAVVCLEHVVIMIGLHFIFVFNNSSVVIIPIDQSNGQKTSKDNLKRKENKVKKLFRLFLELL